MRALPLERPRRRDRLCSIPMDLKKGQRVGEYVLERALGAGGGGSVWRAHHAFIPEKRVALKFPRDDSVLAWLRREGLIQARLHHPTIVQVFGGELDGETPYIAMELVEGGDLRGALADGPLEVERTRRIARGILEGLDTAHDAGIVHGDLKPENVLLSPSGGVKLTDFGLATSYLGGDLQHSLSVSRPQVAGTLRYVPPELLESGRPTPRSDLYAFGVVLFEVLVGRVPQGVESLADHGVAAPDLTQLFLACYVPEARRLPDADAALRILDDHARAQAPSGRLIRKRSKPGRSTGFFGWLFGGDPRPAASEADAPPPAAPSGEPAAAPPAARPPAGPRGSQAQDEEILAGWRGRPIAVAGARGGRGEWRWVHVDAFLARPGERVRALDLSTCHAADDGDLARLSGLTALSSLDLSDNTRISDAGLAHLGRLTELSYLSLRGCTGVTDAGLAALGSLAQLSSLELTGCTAIGDAGVRGLAALPALRFLFLDGCTGVSPATVEALRAGGSIQWVSG